MSNAIVCLCKLCSAISDFIIEEEASTSQRRQPYLLTFKGGGDVCNGSPNFVRPALALDKRRVPIMLF
jgi:hypothetical protein